MKSTFTANPGNPYFDHHVEIKETFEKLGFNKLNIQTSLTNGISHYVSVDLEVLDEGKMPMDIFVFEGVSFVQVRVSDHDSNLERFGGVAGNKISFQMLKKLLENNVAKPFSYDKF